MEHTCYPPGYKPRKWYNSHAFPLIPVFTYKKAEKYNTTRIGFDWLFLRIWSLDTFGFEFGVQADTHFGIGFTAILPYTRIVLCIPIPQKIQWWIQKHLWRKAPAD